MPGSITSIHTVLYLPTAGRDDQFMSCLVELEAHIDDINLKYPDAAHFVRGDGNSNPKKIATYNLFSHFCSMHSFTRVPLSHTTYHHFVGDGLFDSEIDVLFFRGPERASESLDKIICRLESPLINSQHDLSLSQLISLR